MYIRRKQIGLNHQNQLARWAWGYAPGLQVNPSWLANGIIKSSSLGVASQLCLQ